MNLFRHIGVPLACCTLALCGALGLAILPAHAATTPFTNPSSYVTVVSVGTASDPNLAQEFAQYNIDYFQGAKGLGSCQQTSSTTNNNDYLYGVSLVERCALTNTTLPAAKNQPVVFLANGFDPSYADDEHDAATSVVSLADGFQAGAHATCNELTRDSTSNAYAGPQGFNANTDDSVAVAYIVSDCTFANTTGTNNTNIRNGSIGNSNTNFKVKDVLRSSNTATTNAGTTSSRSGIWTGNSNNPKATIDITINF